MESTEREREHLPTREGYDRWSEIYDGEDNPLVALESMHLPRLLGPVRGLRCADIGCGTGRHALALAEAGAEVVAVDFSTGMLEQARAKPGAERVRFIEHDLARPLPLADASFDRVLCCLVLDHIAELEALFVELRRICRPGGFVLASVMHPAMMLVGVQARFTDPKSGREVRPASVPNQLSSYVMAVTSAGLLFDRLEEHVVDEALIARSPRAAKYPGWPLLVLLRLRPDLRASWPLPVNVADL